VAPGCGFARLEGFAAGFFRTAGIRFAGKNPLDLIRRAVSDRQPIGVFLVPGAKMQSIKILCVLALLIGLPAHHAAAQASLGAQGGEGEPDRRQQWLVPSPDQATVAHALLFRPAGDGPFPLAIVAHATSQNVLRRAQMPQPEYRALAAWLVARGYAVLVPERPGHGATGGRYLEDQDGCDEADYAKAGRATADSIAAALDFMHGQSFVRQDNAVIVGHSAGAWGGLALAERNPLGLAAIIAFGPGRGGHANDLPNQVCAPHTLIAAAAEFGKAARVPVTWLVAANDSYFAPDLSRRIADAFRAGGDKVNFRVAAAYGSEGHWLPETEGGVKAVGPELDRALKAQVVIASQRVARIARPMTASAKQSSNRAAKTGLLRRKRSSQ
jgi:dienelactone hydrolase